MRPYWSLASVRCQVADFGKPPLEVGEDVTYEVKIMTDIASIVKTGTNADLRIERLEAMESAKIDRSETSFQGPGPHMSLKQLQEYMAEIDEIVEEDIW
jgi:hypothetical protein